MAAAMVLRRWGEYAFIRPGREMLFSKVDKESKYKAKNVCDVAVYRIADAGFAQLKKFARWHRHGRSRARRFHGRGVAALWAINGWWLGRRTRRKRADPASDVGNSRAGIGRHDHGRAGKLLRVRARRSGMPSSVIRHFAMTRRITAWTWCSSPAGAIAITMFPKKPTRDAAGVFEGRIFQREYPRPLPLHARRS